MSHITRRILLGAFALIGGAATLSAAPKLRLSTAAVGPVSATQGQNAATQTIDSWNAGDGALSLRFTPSVSWIQATTGPNRGCNAGTCTPIVIALNTASLPAGTQTGFLTVADPNAVDAPQTVTVTVQVGGSVPNQITMYVAPNGAETRRAIVTSTSFETRVIQPGAGPRLSVVAEGAGSVRSTYRYNIIAVTPENTADGTYNGSIQVTNSPIAAENKTMQVALNVTRSPIAVSSLAEVRFRLGQGVAAQTQYIVMSNGGMGTLQVTGASATTASGGSWLATNVVGEYVGVTADPANVAPGSYTGEVKITTNAANNELTIPVTLNVVAMTAPVSTFGGVVSNANFLAGDLAQGDLPAVFGEMFTTGAPVGATSLPLPTTLGGTSVFINDQPAPIFYSSYGQVNFQVPYDAKTGDGTLRVDREGQRGNPVSIRIVERSPRIMVVTKFVATGQPEVPVTAATTGPLAPVSPGDVLIMYCLGLGPTNPSVTSGAASPASATVPGSTRLSFGGAFAREPVYATPQFVGLTPGFVGLYQINVAVPSNVDRGPQVALLIQGAYPSSNIVLLNIP